MTNSTSPPTILIAEDDPDDQLLMREAFSERCHDCRLCFVNDGVQLMRILNGEGSLPSDTDDSCETPDLVLLDLNMPLKDGRKALQEIKSDTGLRAIPTVVMTTSDNEEDIIRCYDAGANSYIVKPSSYSGLLEVVSSLTSYWATTVALPKKQGHHDHE